MPYDPGTEAALDPVNPAEEATDAGAARARLVLPKDKRVSVVILSGPRKGDVAVLDKPRVVVGRAGGGAAADLEVPDPEMSRAHAALECHGSRIVLADLGSRNGSFVGDVRVTSHDLEDKAEFRLGGTTFLLVLADR